MQILNNDLNRSIMSLVNIDVKLKIKKIYITITIICTLFFLQGCVFLDVISAVASSRSTNNSATNVVNSSNSFGSLEGCSIVAHDGTFLGIISSNKYNTNYIINEYGKYGSKYNTDCIYNTYGKYGSSYSDLSPFSKYTNTPPVICYNGKVIAYLTINTSLSPRVDPYALIGWLHASVSVNDNLASQGLKPDDKIVSIGNQDISSDKEEELKVFIKHNIGKHVNVTIERDGKQQILAIVIPKNIK